jgi:hypothetical protein
MLTVQLNDVLRASRNYPDLERSNLGALISDAMPLLLTTGTLVLNSPTPVIVNVGRFLITL